MARCGGSFESPGRGSRPALGRDQTIIVRTGHCGTENARAGAQASALVVWLLGKTGAGKTAIIAALTGDARAEIGLGFEPCTRTAAFYDVPREAPLLRFLDTRGVGEAGYDPAG